MNGLQKTKAEVAKEARLSLFVDTIRICVGNSKRINDKTNPDN